MSLSSKSLQPPHLDHELHNIEQELLDLLSEHPNSEKKSHIQASQRRDCLLTAWREATAAKCSTVDSINMELLSCSSESDRLNLLHRLFAEGCETNKLTWLIALSQSKGRDECERILRVEMPKRRIRPVDGHWIYLMRYCSLKEREAVLQNLTESQGEAGVGVWTSVMAGQKCAADREKILVRMVAAGVQPNAVTWCVLIAGYSSGADKERALNRMVEAGMQPNAHTCSEVIAGYPRGAERERALERMVAAGVQPNIVTWNAVIAGYSSGAEKERVHLRMVASGVQANTATWSVVIAGYSSGAEREGVIQRMVASGVQPDTSTWSAVIGGYHGAERERALERMVAAGVQPSADNWSVVIAGYFTATEKEEVIKRMVATGMQPNGNTLTNIMGSYTSFIDRAAVLQRVTTAPLAVIATSEIIKTLFGPPDAFFHWQTVLDITRGLPDDVLCTHATLGKLLPMCAGANDLMLLRRLWGIGTAGLINP